MSCSVNLTKLTTCLSSKSSTSSICVKLTSICSSLEMATIRRVSLSDVDGNKICHLRKILAQAAKLSQVGHEWRSGARAKVDHKRAPGFGKGEKGHLGLG